MNIIDKTRELAKLLQEQEIYKEFNELKKKNDEDEKLQSLIGEFNLKRLSLNNVLKEDEKDEEKIKKLNSEIKICYDKIMQNKNMIDYNNKSEEFEALLKRITSIIMCSAQGEDPMTADYKDTCSSEGCASCNGCK